MNSLDEATEITEDKMVKLLSKLPQICPKIENFSKSEQLKTVSGNTVNFCYVCNKYLVQAEEKVVSILNDVTSRMNNVGNLLATIFKANSTTWDICHLLCSSCYVMIDRFDNLQAELIRIETEMSSSLSTSQQVREQRFLHGKQPNCKQDTQHVWLPRISVRLTSDSSGQNQLRPVDLLSRNLPSVNCNNLHIASHLPDIDIFLNLSQLKSLSIAISDLDFQPLVQFDQLLQHSPLFSLSNNNLMIELQEISTPVKHMQCKDCNFVTAYFHLLIPHLHIHAREQEQSLIPHTMDNIEYNLKLECYECGKNFKKSDILEAHVRKEHKGVHAPWQCNYCEKGFTRKASLEEHISRHQGVKQRHCEICDKYFYHTAYWRHLTTVHPQKEKLKHKCPHCSKVFALKFKLDIHLQSHMSHTDKKYYCNDCPGKRFASEEKLKSHRRNVHSKVEASHLCGECGASYSNYPALYHHCKRSHKGTVRAEPHSKLQLQGEEEGTNPFLCGFDHCNKGFSSIRHLQEHQLHNHKGAIDDDDTDNVIYMGDIHDTDEPHCGDLEISNKAIDLRLELDNTMVVNGANVQSAEDQENYLRSETEQLAHERCSNIEANQAFANHVGQNYSVEREKQELTTNIQNIVNLDMCEQNMIILTEDQGKELIQALNIDMENGIETYPCNFCEKSYRSEKSRTMHVKSAHINEKPFQCPICEKAFSCQNYLTEHKKIHFSLGRFRCSLCDKTFSSNKVLKRHFRIHTGEKPFKCEYCGKCFAAASNLSEHRTLHTGRMPYTCTGCGGKFRLWTTLKKHTVKCDGVQPTGVKEKVINTGESEGGEMLVVDDDIEKKDRVETFHISYTI